MIERKQMLTLEKFVANYTHTHTNIFDRFNFISNNNNNNNGVYRIDSGFVSNIKHLVVVNFLFL